MAKFVSGLEISGLGAVYHLNIDQSCKSETVTCVGAQALTTPIDVFRHMDRVEAGGFGSNAIVRDHCSL